MVMGGGGAPVVLTGVELGGGPTVEGGDFVVFGGLVDVGASVEVGRIVGSAVVEVG